MIYYTDRFEGGREHSHRLLEKAVAAYVQDAEKAADLMKSMKKGRNGKPYIEDFSCFSISHTGRIWAVLICERECGLDIQLEKKCDISAISRRLFAPEDADMVCGTGSLPDDTGRFFSIWVRREALTKALGGSVYDTTLPQVSCDEVITAGRTYLIKEIELPLASDPPCEKLHAAVCTESGEASWAEELNYTYLDL